MKYTDPGYASTVILLSIAGCSLLFAVVAGCDSAAICPLKTE